MSLLSLSNVDMPHKLLTPDIVNMITALHEYKGKQELYVKCVGRTTAYVKKKP